MDYIIYIIYRFFEYILYALPRVFKKPILHFLAFIVYLFAKKHNRIAKVIWHLVIANLMMKKKLLLKVHIEICSITLMSLWLRKGSP